MRYVFVSYFIIVGIGKTMAILCLISSSLPLSGRIFPSRLHHGLPPEPNLPEASEDNRERRSLVAVDKL